MFSFSQKNLKRLLQLQLLIILSFVIAGCSDTETKEQDPSITAIRAVIEKEFDGYDKEYNERWDKLMASTAEIDDEEEYDKLWSSPLAKELKNYEKDTYAAYFTEDGFERFLNVTPAFMYSLGNPEDTLSISDLKVTQSDKNPALYFFSFEATHQKEGTAATYPMEGRATTTEDGKIELIEYADQAGLQQALNPE